MSERDRDARAQQVEAEVEFKLESGMRINMRSRVSTRTEFKVDTTTGDEIEFRIEFILNQNSVRHRPEN